MNHSLQNCKYVTYLLLAACDIAARTCVGGSDRWMWIHYQLEHTACLPSGG